MVVVFLIHRFCVNIIESEQLRRAQHEYHSKTLNVYVLCTQLKRLRSKQCATARSFSRLCRFEIRLCTFCHVDESCSCKMLL